MSIGSNINKYRKAKGFSQEKLSEMLDVTFQAVSAWERDEYRPELDTFVRMCEILEVPATSIIEDKTEAFITKKTIYNWEHMKTYVKTMAKAEGMENTQKALDFAVNAHKEEKRKNSDVPYIYHPLNMACHALSMGIKEDEIIAAILLHDVPEDCYKSEGVKYEPEDMPVNEEAIELVRLMTLRKTGPDTRQKDNDKYYKGLAANPKGALIKLIDRCNNLTSMSWGLTKEKMIRMIKETEKYYPALVQAVKDVPKYNDAAWLLKYQIESMLDIYKRLI